MDDEGGWIESRRRLGTALNSYSRSSPVLPRSGILSDI